MINASEAENNFHKNAATFHGKNTQSTRGKKKKA